MANTQEEILENQLDQINQIESHGRHSASFRKWHFTTLNLIIEICGPDSRQANLFQDIEQVQKNNRAPMLIEKKNFKEDLEKAKVLILEVIKLNRGLNSSFDSVQQDDVNFILELCHRFPSFSQQLTKKYRNREIHAIQDEYDVQHLFHALLLLRFNDVRPEDVNPSYAGATSRVDFLLKQEKIVIEVKKTRNSLKDKEVGEQLIVDILRYSSNQDCQVLICFVYDPERLISNPVGIENDLSKSHEGVNVKVVISPKN